MTKIFNPSVTFWTPCISHCIANKTLEQLYLKASLLDKKFTMKFKIMEFF